VALVASFFDAGASGAALCVAAGMAARGAWATDEAAAQRFPVGLAAGLMLGAGLAFLWSSAGVVLPGQLLCLTLLVLAADSYISR
jgi:hypothetical protein